MGRIGVTAPAGGAAVDVAAGVGPDNEVLVTRGLSKTFGETRALISVDFNLAAGEIRALVGGNGSGKSTFIKILAGVERPDRGGMMRLPTGVERDNGVTPEVAREAGFRFVHQDTGVIDDLSVGENLVLGRGFPRNRLGLIKWRAVRAQGRQTLERFDVGVGPDHLVKNLSALARTKVAVARALQDVDTSTRGVLVFDEPTTSMSTREAQTFLDWLRGFAGRGQSIIFVSHRLDEVLAFAGSVTVFRDGAHVATLPRSSLDEGRMVELMTGRQLPRLRTRAPLPSAESCRLELRDLTAGPLRGVDLRLGRGEVVGVAGLLGSGRTSLFRAVAGDLATTGGEMLLDGRPHRPSSIADAMASGIGYVPEDRLAEAVFPDLSVAENVMAGSVDAFTARGWVSSRREREAAERLVEQFRIRCGSTRHSVATLSGGNQQKVVMARWLQRRPRVLLLDEPSQGVDVMARSDIDEFIRQGAAEGMSVLMVTSDFGDMARVVDRVVVLRHGRIMAELVPPDLSEEAITQLTHGMMGVQDVHAGT